MRTTDLFNLAESLVEKHLTLDPSVDPSVGCAEAVSYVLKQFGTVLPQKGIAGTAALADFLSKSSDFKEINTFDSGAIIVAPTGSGNGSIRGHTGICTDKGTILSNDSNTGLWTDHWKYADWVANYYGRGGIVSRFFVPVEKVSTQETQIEDTAYKSRLQTLIDLLKKLLALTRK